jgi:hypothetical protein
MSNRPAYQDWKKVKFKKQENRVRGEHDFSIRLESIPALRVRGVAAVTKLRLPKVGSPTLGSVVVKRERQAPVTRLE